MSTISLRAWPRAIWVLAFLAFVRSSAAPVLAQDASPIVALENPTHQKGSDYQVLAREVVRQAFLMTARDQYGARTRDALLREPIPAAAETRVFRLDILQPKVGEQSLTLTGVRGTAPFTTETAKLNGPGEDGQLVMVLGQVDSLTTGLFARALQGARLSPRPAAAAAVAVALPPTNPAPLEFTSQIASLRKWHAALQVAPKSPRILAGLAREYALLGTVAEIHWGIEHKVFKARALLYAERACREAPQSPDAAWTRGLVRMVCGLHALAAAEIQRAGELDKGGTVSGRPNWAEELLAFSRWESTKLAELAKSERPLAAHFHMLQTEIIGSRDQRMAADKRLVELQPECFRAVGALANEWPLGVRRAVGPAQIRQFTLSLPRLLQQIEPWPADFAQDLKTRAAREADAAEEPDLAAHAALLTRLRGLDVAADRSEPSIGVVATLCENLSFVHALQVVTTQHHWLAVDAADEIQAMQRMLGPHPYAAYLGIYQRDHKQSQAIFEKVAGPLLELPLSLQVFKNARFDALTPAQAARMTEAVREPRDAVATDLLTLMEDTYSDKIKKGQVSILRRLSPDCPAVTAVEVRLDWKKVARRAAGLAETSGSTVLLQALAARYAAAEESEPESAALAEKCLVRMTEIDQSFESANALASYYWEHRKYDRWKEVTVESLTLPSYGLEDALASARLAEWMMDHGEWTEAEPYAQRAAETYATAGLQAAARCMEGQERWAEAERLYRAKSERYFGSWADWYFFCRRTGRGDLEAATRFSQQQLANLPESETTRQFLAAYYQLTGEPEEAIRVHRAYLTDKGEGGYATSCSLLLLDELKRTKERDALINAPINDREGTADGLLAELIRRPGGSQGKRLTDGELELCYASSAERNQPTNTAYFLGKLLLNRGDAKRATVWFERAASSPQTHLWTSTLAGDELIKLGVAIPFRRKTEWAEGFVEVAAKQHDILAMWNPKSLSEVRKQITKALAVHGASLSLRIMAGNGARDAGDLAVADQFYTKVLGELPGHPHVLTLRGKVREGLGREREAVADYEAALATCPVFRSAHNNLAWIESSSADSKLRDKAAALRHARAAEELGPDPLGVGPVALAAAHAEAGEFDAAVKLIEGAIQAKRYPDPDRLQGWLESYRKKKPYRRPAPK